MIPEGIPEQIVNPLVEVGTFLEIEDYLKRKRKEILDEMEEMKKSLTPQKVKDLSFIFHHGFTSTNDWLTSTFGPEAVLRTHLGVIHGRYEVHGRVVELHHHDEVRNHEPEFTINRKTYKAFSVKAYYEIDGSLPTDIHIVSNWNSPQLTDSAKAKCKEGITPCITEAIQFLDTVKEEWLLHQFFRFNSCNLQFGNNDYRTRYCREHLPATGKQFYLPNG